MPINIPRLVLNPFRHRHETGWGGLGLLSGWNKSGRCSDMLIKSESGRKRYSEQTYNDLTPVNCRASRLTNRKILILKYFNFLGILFSVVNTLMAKVSDDKNCQLEQQGFTAFWLGC